MESPPQSEMLQLLPVKVAACPELKERLEVLENLDDQENQEPLVHLALPESPRLSRVNLSHLPRANPAHRVRQVPPVHLGQWGTLELPGSQDSLAKMRPQENRVQKARQALPDPQERSGSQENRDNPRNPSRSLRARQDLLETPVFQAHQVFQAIPVEMASLVLPDQRELPERWGPPETMDYQAPQANRVSLVLAERRESVRSIVPSMEECFSKMEKMVPNKLHSERYKRCLAAIFINSLHYLCGIRGKIRDQFEILLKVSNFQKIVLLEKIEINIDV